MVEIFVKKMKALMKNSMNAMIRRMRGLFRPSARQNRRKLEGKGLGLHFHIREASAEDVPCLAELHVQSWNETYGVVARGPSIETRMTQWGAMFRSKGGSTAGEGSRDEDWFCLLAENERGEVVGFVKGQRYAHEDLPEYRGELNKLYVLRDYQRLGIGRMLMYEAARRLVEMGIDNMVLFGIPQNPSGGFYEAMGGERLYARNGEFHGGYGWKDLKVLL